MRASSQGEKCLSHGLENENENAIRTLNNKIPVIDLVRASGWLAQCCFSSGPDFYTNFANKSVRSGGAYAPYMLLEKQIYP